MTDIVIQGISGRMGHVLCEMIASAQDCRVVAGMDLKDGGEPSLCMTVWKICPTARAMSSSISPPPAPWKMLCLCAELTSCPSWSAPPAFRKSCS